MTEANSAHEPQASNKRAAAIGIPIAGLLVLVAILWWGFGESLPYGSETPETPETPIIAQTPEPPPTPEPTVEPPPPEVTEPEIVQELETPPEPPAPPTLAEANERLASGTLQVSASPLAATFISAPNLIERLVAIIDNLRQGFVPYKLLPVGRPEVAFSFVDDGLGVTMNPTGFERYDGLARLISEIDTNTLVDAFTSVEITTNEAWSALGYDSPNLEAAILGALETIMLAPETDLEARLYKVEANWVYEDPALEALSPLQKQLMRMGPANGERVKEKAREIRGALLDR